MASSQALARDTEHLARTVVRSYSKAALEHVASEMGAPVHRGENIFRALILAGKAVDFDHAVRLVVAYLDAGGQTADPLQGHFTGGKIERRGAPRAGHKSF